MSLRLTKNVKIFQVQSVSSAVCLCFDCEKIIKMLINANVSENSDKYPPQVSVTQYLQVKCFLKEYLTNNYFLTVSVSKFIRFTNAA